MSSHIVPTVMIVREGKEVRINKSDYNPEIHKLVGEVTEPIVGDFNNMTIKELRKYAEENNIDLKKATTKADILAVIQKPENEELFIFPTAEGKFQIIGSDGKAVNDEVYETQEDAEKALLGE